MIRESVPELGKSFRKSFAIKCKRDSILICTKFDHNICVYLFLKHVALFLITLPYKLNAGLHLYIQGAK